MNCPRCQTSELEEKDRDGVTIDVCRACRGLWLDRGELEKLIARATRDFDEAPPRQERHYDDDKVDSSRRDPRNPRKKRRWYETLGDVFD
jgi:Zn-finger nucleic acid-binding protein